MKRPSARRCAGSSRFGSRWQHRGRRTRCRPSPPVGELVHEAGLPAAEPTTVTTGSRSTAAEVRSSASRRRTRSARCGRSPEDSCAARGRAGAPRSGAVAARGRARGQLLAEVARASSYAQGRVGWRPPVEPGHEVRPPRSRSGWADARSWRSTITPSTADPSAAPARPRLLEVAMPLLEGRDRAASQLSSALATDDRSTGRSAARRTSAQQRVVGTLAPRRRLYDEVGLRRKR